MRTPWLIWLVPVCLVTLTVSATSRAQQKAEPASKKAEPKSNKATPKPEKADPWHPDSFAMPAYSHVLTRNRVTLAGSTEARFRRKKKVIKKQPFNFKHYTGQVHTVLGGEIQLFPQLLSVYAHATSQISLTRGLDEATADWQVQQALVGIKVALSRSFFNGSAGVGLGTCNLDPDDFAGADGFLLRPFATAQFRFSWLVLAMTLEGTYIYPTDSIPTSLPIKSWDDALWFDLSARAAAMLGKYTAVQLEGHLRHFINDRTAAPLGWWNTEHDTEATALAGLRFGAEKFALGLSFMLPLNHVCDRWDFGLSLDVSFLY